MTDNKPEVKSGFLACKACRMVFYFGIIAAALIFALIGRLDVLKGESEGNGVAVVGPQTSTGTAAIGGPFELVDHTGKTVTEQDFVGKFTMVYFGFTYCPDVCPTSLTMIGTALDQMDPALVDQVAVAFITIDPERDTPEALAHYVEHFHPNTVGLSGSMEQIRAAAKAYRVYFKKIEDKDSPPGSLDYLMDHSSITYVMGPDGLFAAHFPHGAGPAQMAETMTKLINGKG